MQETNNSLALKEQWHPHSIKLIEQINTGDKMQLMATTNQLMPQGIPDFKTVVQCTPIAAMLQQCEYKDMLKVMVVMVADLCSSVNVVRNMTDDQMLEAAGMLLSECGDFRLEDYQIMFTMAKRGQLVKIMDRIDISLIGTMIDAYYAMRRAQGIAIQEEEFKKADNAYNDKRAPEVTDANGVDYFSKAVEALTNWKKEDDAKEEQEKAKLRLWQVEGYAKLYNVNFDEVYKQFKKNR